MTAVATSAWAKHAGRPEWALICRVGDILPGSGVAALANGVPVAVFRLSDDRLFAIGNVDPFSQASVLSRGIVGDVDGDPVVASPIYKQHFRLEDGICVEDPSVRVPTYRVLGIDGGVILQVSGRR